MKGAAVFFCILGVAFGQSSIKVPPPPTSPPQTDAPTDAPTNPPTAAATDASTAAGYVDTRVADPNCKDNDKNEPCNRFTNDQCIGQYAGWAKGNCARYCGYCLHPNDTNPVCEDKIDNCNLYQGDLCTAELYRIFSEENCLKFCNKCDFRPRYIIAQENAPSPSAPAVVTSKPDPTSGCHDLVDYCWNEPDDSCFGIFEPWARKNCPFRCFYCQEKPVCADSITFCAQYGKGVCTDPKYVGYMRKNCRAYCGMCDAPVKPDGVATVAPGAAIIAPSPPSTGGAGGNPSGGAPSGPGQAPPKPSGATGTDQTVKPTSNSQGVTVTQTPIILPMNSTLIGQKATFVVQGAVDPDSVTKGACFYKGEAQTQDSQWFDGCDYICSCFDAARNRVICTQRCTQWAPLPVQLKDTCFLVKEPGNCCEKLECKV